MIEKLIKRSKELNVKLEGNELFDEFSLDMLYIKDENNLEEHLNTLPVLFFYYSHLLNQSKAEYDDIISRYEFWRNQAYKIVAEELLQQRKRPTIQDINVEVDVRFEKEINEWKNKIDKKRESYEILKTIVNALTIKKDTLLELAKLRRQNLDLTTYEVKEKTPTSKYKTKLLEAEEILRNKKEEK